MSSENPHLAEPLRRLGAPAGPAGLGAVLVHGRGQDTDDLLQDVTRALDAL